MWNDWLNRSVARGDANRKIAIDISNRLQTENGQRWF